MLKEVHRLTNIIIYFINQGIKVQRRQQCIFSLSVAVDVADALTQNSLQIRLFLKNEDINKFI